MTTSCTELLAALRDKASPLPWHTTPDADANNQYTVLAVNHFAACVKALEEIRDVAMGDCLSPEDYGHVVIRCEELARDALTAARTDLEAALEVK